MYGRKYQWLIMGTYSTNWWLASVESSNCSLEELSEALEGCILTDLLPLSTNGEITISGSVSHRFLNPLFQVLHFLSTKGDSR